MAMSRNLGANRRVVLGALTRAGLVICWAHKGSHTAPRIGVLPRSQPPQPHSTEMTSHRCMRRCMEGLHSHLLLLVSVNPRIGVELCQTRPLARDVQVQQVQQPPRQEASDVATGLSASTPALGLAVATRSHFAPPLA